MYLNKAILLKKKNKVVHGFMDLVIYKEDEIIIIDFKTDTTDNENKLIDMYAARLQTYKHSMERITDSPIKTYIYAFLYLNASFYNNLCYNGGSFEKREKERDSWKNSLN